MLVVFTSRIWPYTPPKDPVDEAREKLQSVRGKYGPKSKEYAQALKLYQCCVDMYKWSSE